MKDEKLKMRDLQILGIYTSRIHWVVWGTGTPKERLVIDERFENVMGECVI
jgi:hypothetical protein